MEIALPAGSFALAKTYPSALCHSAEREPVFSSPGAKCFDVGHIENQLGDGLASFAPTAQGIEHDVGPSVSGTLQLYDAITFFSVNSEAEITRVEFGHGVDVADVKQNSAKDVHGRKRLALLGHHTARVACRGTTETASPAGSPGRAFEHMATVARQAKKQTDLLHLGGVEEIIR